MGKEGQGPKPRLNAVQSRVFGALRKAVAKLTGYEIESISVEDRFEEDLAIDSLQKLLVLFEVMREVDPEPQELGGLDGLDAVQTLADAVEALTQSKDEKNAPHQPIRSAR